MKFKTGWRNTNLSVVVLRARKMRDSFGESVGTSPAVRAEFRNHEFDSDSTEMQDQYKRYAEWHNDRSPEHPMTPEDVQKRLEDGLMNHKDYNKKIGGWGFWKDEPKRVRHESQPGPTNACAQPISKDAEGYVIVCSNPIAEGETMFCEEHAAKKEEVGVS